MDPRVRIICSSWVREYRDLRRRTWSNPFQRFINFFSDFTKTREDECEKLINAIDTSESYDEIVSVIDTAGEYAQNAQEIKGSGIVDKLLNLLPSVVGNPFKDALNWIWSGNSEMTKVCLAVCTKWREGINNSEYREEFQAEIKELWAMYQKLDAQLDNAIRKNLDTTEIEKQHRQCFCKLLYRGDQNMIVFATKHKIFPTALPTYKNISNVGIPPVFRSDGHNLYSEDISRDPNRVKNFNSHIKNWPEPKATRFEIDDYVDTVKSLTNGGLSEETSHTNATGELEFDSLEEIEPQPKEEPKIWTVKGFIPSQPLFKPAPKGTHGINSKEKALEKELVDSPTPPNTPTTPENR